MAYEFNNNISDLDNSATESIAWVSEYNSETDSEKLGSFNFNSDVLQSIRNSKISMIWNSPKRAA
jgi:hypothetical protein